MSTTAISDKGYDPAVMPTKRQYDTLMLMAAAIVAKMLWRPLNTSDCIAVSSSMSRRSTGAIFTATGVEPLMTNVSELVIKSYELKPFGCAARQATNDSHSSLAPKATASHTT